MTQQDGQIRMTILNTYIPKFPRGDSKPKKRLRENRAIIHQRQTHTWYRLVFLDLFLGLESLLGNSWMMIKGYTETRTNAPAASAAFIAYTEALPRRASARVIIVIVNIIITIIILHLHKYTEASPRGMFWRFAPRASRPAGRN